MPAQSIPELMTAEELEAGTKLVWVIDPHGAEARVYRPDGSLTIIGTDGVLVGEDVLPGFACVLKDVLS